MKELRFRIGDDLLTEAQVIEKMIAPASKYKGRQKALYLEMVQSIFNDQKMKNKLNTLYAPAGGVVLLLIILTIAFISPFPTRFQTNVYWIILAVGAAGAAALIPGFFEFKYQGWVRGGGALGVLILMYLRVPAIDSTYQADSGNSMAIYLVGDSTGGNVQLFSPPFDRNSTGKISAYISNVLEEYGSNMPDTSYTCYRKSDGKIYKNESCNELREWEILIIPNELLRKFPNKRQAYLNARKLTVKTQE